MSLKSLLMPVISQRLLAPQRLAAQRARQERARRARGEPHRVHYFHQVDDPYSALAAAALPALAARYDVEVVPHVVGPPPDAAAPDRGRLVAYSRCDAQRLARHRGLAFADPGRQPPPEAVATATRLLVGAIASGRFVEVAGEVSRRLWSESRPSGATAGDGVPATWTGAAGAQGVPDALADGGPLPPATAQGAQAHVAAADALRERLGHYLGATFFYAGEWYWGIDRLYHLEQRLTALGARRSGSDVGGDLLYPPDPDLDHVVALADPPPIDFFFSLRSPYSAIVAPRVFELGRRTGAPMRLRFVLPMVMRGLPVPPAKRRYIAFDAAREARARGIAFGRINDPVGRPAERGLALMPLAERQGRGEAYVLSFMRGVWAEGIDAGSDRGLRRIAERAGLSWTDAQAALADAAWRETAERNRAELFSLGLWGVPSFRVRDTVVWGQDRLWAVQEALLAATGSAVAAAAPS